MRREVFRAVLIEGLAPPPAAALPVSVERAARVVYNDEALLDLIREDWPHLEMVAERDRFFGQGGQTDSPDYQEALEGLRAFLRWAGPAGEYARGLATGEALFRCTDPAEFTALFTGAKRHSQEEQAAQDVAAVERLEALLSRCSLGHAPRKAEKGFLSVLASCAHEWHDELGLPPPAKSNNSPVVKLMQAIASALKVEVGPDSHRKSLAAARAGNGA